MNNEDILAFVRAGYTKAEIEAMEKPADKGEPGEKPEAKPRTDAAALNAAAKENAESKPAGGATNDDVIAALKEMTATMRESNFFRDVGEGPSGSSQTAEEILMGLFTDPKEKNK